MKRIERIKHVIAHQKERLASDEVKNNRVLRETHERKLAAAEQLLAFRTGESLPAPKKK